MISLSGIDRYWPVSSESGSDGRVYGLRSVDLLVNRGEFVTIVGPSCSGKSTLLQIIGLLDVPSGGQFLLENNDVLRLSDRERARLRNRFFGFVFQDSHLLPELTALENVELPMIYAGIPSRQRRERAGELLEKVALLRRADCKPDVMSGGEQQCVAIARALANDPGFLLADEPAGNLPAEGGKHIMEIMRGLNKEGLTIIMAMRDDLPETAGTHRVCLAGGKISS